MTHRLLTVDDVAALVQLGPEAVRRAVRRGDLEAVRIGGRLRFKPRAVDAWIASSARPRRPLALPPTQQPSRLDHLMEQHRPAA